MYHTPVAALHINNMSTVDFHLTSQALQLQLWVVMHVVQGAAQMET